MPFLVAAGHRLEYSLIPGPAHRPVMVFLHEGLGSVAMWRDFPAQCASHCNCPALVYSRYGYGESDIRTEPRRPDYLHHEALVALPDLLDQLDIHNPILFGHSDGASIALIHRRPVAGIIAVAPHVFVEREALQGIAAAEQLWRTTPMRDKLARFHRDADSVFAAWRDIWTAPEFASWNIEEYLPRITCPLLVVQGEEDEYGTMEQLDRIQHAVPHATQLRLSPCGHSPHRDQPAKLMEAVQAFTNFEKISAFPRIR